MAQVELKNIQKIYENGVQAVYDFNLSVEEKEFIVLVGPSGCGKTTTLRMIAGLEDITAGELYINGKYVNELPPKDRGIAMVFQNYALYPHMTVAKNLGFVLKVRKYPKAVIEEKVKAVADLLGLTPYLDRKPKALSGGQRQRVALGRAIIRDASVYLYDEPLSNLDAKLRVQMRTSIAKLHKSLGTTSIYVTHDQTEAMTMATRIVVMKDGLIQQIGSPEEIYDRPVNRFVGGFIGTPPMNFLSGMVDEDGWFVDQENKVRLLVPERKLRLLKQSGNINKRVYLGVRPEFIKQGLEAEKESPTSVVEATNILVEMLGHETYVHFNIGNTSLVATIEGKFRTTEESINLVFDLEKSHFFDENELNVSLDDEEIKEVKSKEYKEDIFEDENIESVLESLAELIQE